MKNRLFNASNFNLFKSIKQPRHSSIASIEKMFTSSFNSAFTNFGGFTSNGFGTNYITSLYPTHPGVGFDIGFVTNTIAAPINVQFNYTWTT